MSDRNYEKLNLNNLNIPPRRILTKSYRKLHRIVKNQTYIKLLDPKNSDLFEIICEYNLQYEKRYIKEILLGLNVKSMENNLKIK